MILEIMLAIGVAGLFIYGVHIADKLADCQAAYALLVIKEKEQ